jgi:hypothetical protein
MPVWNCRPATTESKPRLNREKPEKRGGRLYCEPRIPIDVWAWSEEGRERFGFVFFSPLLFRAKAGRSENALIDAIAAGEAEPEARSRRGNKRAIEEEQRLQEDDEPEFYDDEEPEHFAFVSNDSEGEVQTPAKDTSPDVSSSRKKRSYKLGTNSKNKDLEVVDPLGRDYRAEDGVVKINLGKLILRPVTEAEIASKRFRDGKGTLIDEKCWRCLLPRFQPDAHNEFVRIGSNTGNLTQHCETYHQPMLDALARLIEETPKAEAKHACEQLIKNTPAPPGQGSLNGFLGLDANEVSNELLCLIWFLDANISFHQFDNPLFRQLIRDLGGRQFHSSFTQVERLLPVLYSYAVNHMVRCLQECRSFFTSFDGWSKYGERFVSQSYHCINPSSFEYRILALDFIHCQTAHYTEVLAGILQERQEHWTAGMSPEPIVAGGIADGASDVQSAGKWAFGDGADGVDDDMNRCQNHKMKSAYESLEKGAPDFKVALDAVAELFVAVSNSANVNNMLKAYQDVNEISSVAMYIYSDTRWEGRVQVLECALKLRKSLPCLKAFAASQKIGGDCPDFLDEPFFQRLAVYHKHLKVVHEVSRLFQTHRFPAGHLVLLAYHALAQTFLPSPNLAAEAQVETAFREAVRMAIRDCLVAPLTSRANAFAKASIFHPDICRLLQHELLSEAVFEDCVAAVRRDIDALSGEGTLVTEIANVIFTRYLKDCKERPAVALPGFEALKQNGVYGQTDALSYWRNIGKDVGHPFAALIPIASMLLALPAGEAHNEFVFSCSGRIFSRDRNSMSAMRLEQVTVLVMFIRNFGWSQNKMMAWLNKALAEVQSKEKGK